MSFRKRSAMLEAVVICLLIQFCPRIWATLKKKFESWSTEIDEISDYDEDEFEEFETNKESDNHLNENQESTDQRDINTQRKEKNEEEEELPNENSHKEYNAAGTYEQYLVQKQLKRDIDARNLRRQIKSLTCEISTVNYEADVYHRGYVRACEKGLKKKHALFTKYVAKRRKMNVLKETLAELQENLEGKICNDESCSVNKETFRGEDVQEYYETSCRKWHAKRKTGLERGTRPRNSELRLCPRDYSCVNTLCTAWHQKDAKFCTTSWATCSTWHARKCEFKIPEEQPSVPLGKEKRENVLCENDIDTCPDPECTRFHLTDMWIDTLPEGWLRQYMKNTGHDAVPLMMMKLLCHNGKRTTKAPCRKHDCPYRHQYPHIRDKVSPEFNQKLNENRNQDKEKNPIWFCSQTCAIEYGKPKGGKISRTSSATDYTPEAKKVRREEEMIGEARRIERPNEDARLQAEPAKSAQNAKSAELAKSEDNAKSVNIFYDLLASKEFKDFLNKEVPCESSQEKRKNIRNCAKTEHWENHRKTFLEDGTTYLTNVCRKWRKIKREKTTR